MYFWNICSIFLYILQLLGTKFLKITFIYCFLSLILCVVLWRWSLAWRVTARYSQCTFTDCWSCRSESKTDTYSTEGQYSLMLNAYDWCYCAFSSGWSVHFHIRGQRSRSFDHDTERLGFHGHAVGGIASLPFSSHLRLLPFGLPSNTESCSGQPEAANCSANASVWDNWTTALTVAHLFLRCR